jgi:regulator of sigma E protease
MGTVMVYSRVPTSQIVPEAFRLGYRDVDRTLRTLTSLIMHKVSVKDLGGPVMIYHATTTAAQMGYWYLFKITAFISANLCVFNLLPLPILDGGLLVYLAIEGIRRKPLDMKVLERIQQVGFVLIIALLLLVTYNDISRWVVMRLQ